MLRWLVLFFVFLVIGSLLWPWLREVGLVHLPGDMVFRWHGSHFYAPVGTALLCSVVVAWVWRLLDR